MFIGSVHKPSWTSSRAVELVPNASLVVGATTNSYQNTTTLQIGSNGKGSILSGYSYNSSIYSEGMGSYTGGYSYSSSQASDEDAAYGILNTGMGAIVFGATDSLGTYQNAPMKATGKAS